MENHTLVPCSFCPESFTSIAYLSAHYRSDHPVEFKALTLESVILSLYAGAPNNLDPAFAELVPAFAADTHNNLDPAFAELVPAFAADTQNNLDPAFAELVPAFAADTRNNLDPGFAEFVPAFAAEHLVADQQLVPPVIQHLEAAAPHQPPMDPITSQEQPSAILENVSLAAYAEAFAGMFKTCFYSSSS